MPYVDTDRDTDDADTEQEQEQEQGHEQEPEARFPCVLTYPEYDQYDAICGCRAGDFLIEHLASMFPGEEGETLCVAPAPWDRRGDYRFDRLVVYAGVLSTAEQRKVCVVPTREAWMQFCQDAWVLQQGGVQGMTLLLRRLKQRKLDSAEVHEDEDKHEDEDENEEEEEEDDTAQDIAEEELEATRKRVEAVSARVSALAAGSGREVGDAVNSFCHVELGAGCTVGQVLQVPGLVLLGGLLSLKAFVRDSEAHRSFVRAEQARGKKIKLVGPSIDEVRRRLEREQQA
jgi:hypothetical protein